MQAFQFRDAGTVAQTNSTPAAAGGRIVVGENMKNHRNKLLATLALFGASLSHAEYQLNFQQPATSIAQDVYSLHMTLLWICLVIFVIVFGVMFYSIFKHRKSTGHKPADFHESVTVEVVWTVIPLLIVVAMAWQATKVVINQKNTKGADVTVKVTGYQWKWGYDYLDEGFGFHSKLATPQTQYENFGKDSQQVEKKNENYLLEVDNAMVVPVGKKVRLLLTANDVIHSWWVPAFSTKQDAIPGFIRDTWFKADRVGVYRGQCAELCGKDHGFMPIVVNVVSDEDYKKWVSEQKKKAAESADDPNKKWELADLMKRGEKVYQDNCAVCHKPDGKGMGAFPALDGSKIAKGDRSAHVGIVLAGKNAMPGWSKTLSDTEIAAVITYERNAWGNKTGDVVQPSDIKAARK
ncbi:cytochrome c oxidase subunit II [Parachitinimonas caeni]|nr:cytochrome c oxidase subunit II [Parachitinimonas caeni]